jgi:hypothetical protein
MKLALYPITMCNVSFATANNYGKGWILKFPYVTNSRVTYVRKIANLASSIESCWFKMTQGAVLRMSYVMLQPCVPNQMEIKVACWNGDAPFIARRNRGGVQSRSFVDTTDEDVLVFATNAIARLKHSDPNSILNGLARVDIFQLPNKKLVVNEFESLEAEYEQKKAVVTGGAPCAATVNSALKLYWLDIVTACVNEFNLS